jgi:hypothetical protein
MALLLNVFTYAYFSKKAVADEAQCKASNVKLKDSLLVTNNMLDDANYFTLLRNANAREYLVDHDVDKLVPQLTAKIMEFNDNPEGNILVPYDYINGQKFIINKVRVLNHRWIIADFSDGKVWGELLLKYFIEPGGKFTFERIESQLYQPQVVEE